MTEIEDLFECKCEESYSIERHGDGYVLYYGRCPHKHGLNLFYIKEPAYNCNLTQIEHYLNAGYEIYKELSHIGEKRENRAEQ